MIGVRSRGMVRYKFTEKIPQGKMGEEKINNANADLKQFFTKIKPIQRGVCFKVFLEVQYFVKFFFYSFEFGNFI